jgi:iron(III) transport system permease protein
MLSASASQAPMSYGIYLYMQSIAGRGPGAALGVIAVALVGIGTYASYWLLHRRTTVAAADARAAAGATVVATPGTAGASLG